MMHGGDGVFLLFTFLPIIFSLALIVFGIYFIIKIVKFMNAKTKADQERNERLSELIDAINQSKRSE